MVPPMIRALPPAHSPLFDAARELLRPDGDVSAAVAQVQGAYPSLSRRECRQVLREVATALHVTGGTVW